MWPLHAVAERPIARAKNYAELNTNGLPSPRRHDATSAAHTAQPTLKIIHESAELPLSHGTTLFDGSTIDGALDVEDRVVPLHGFDRNGRLR
jgi:hypothetical protein